MVGAGEGESDSARRVLDRLAQALATTLAVPLVLITVDGPGGPAIAGAYAARADHDRTRLVPLVTPLCRQVLATGKPVIVHDARRRAAGEDPALATLDAVAYVGLAIVLDGVAIGALAAIDHHVRSWSERDVLALRELADLAAIALDQARALDRERSLGALLVRAASATNLRDVLAAFVDHTRCASAAIVTIDRGRARTLAAFDADRGGGRRAVAAPWPVDIELIVREAVLTGEPVWRADQQRDALAIAIPGSAEVLEVFIDDARGQRAELTRVAGATAALLGATLVRLRPDHGDTRRTSELEILALHDELTGLLNRRGFLAVAGGQLALAQRKTMPGVVLFIDIDGLKAVNDADGHAAGDALLRRAAAVLRATFRESDTIARVGGDEFVVFSMDATDHDLVAVTGRLSLELDRVNRLAGAPTPLRWSVGYASFDGTIAIGLDALMTEADRRMYASKRGNRAPTSS